jgi:hypothetical protein
MGIFTEGHIKASENIFEKEVKQYLVKKDGNVHVLMINSFSKWLNQLFGVENKYTSQIDTVLSNMQEMGYEIVRVEHSTTQNQGLFKNMEGFHTLITYK